MAEFDDPAFWLPQEILTDSEDEISPKVGFGSRKMSLFGSDSDGDSKPALFPFELPNSGFWGFRVPSEMSWPVESSGTESDEEEYLAGLTRQLAQSTLDDEFKRYDLVLGSKNNSKAWVSPGSPQSILCAPKSGCSCGGQGSSRGSPDAQSPPATWDLLHAAAGEVAKMRFQEETLRFNQKSRGILGAPREPSPVTIPDFGYYLQHQQQSLSQKDLQFERLRQQQILQNNISAAFAQANGRFQHHRSQSHSAVQNRVRNTNNGHLALSPSAWPPLQQAQRQPFQPNGPGFRDPLMGGAKKESTGTGVFLPRQIGTPSENPRGRKQQPKQACPTVFVPAKVVHALKLNAEEMRVQSQPQVHHNRFNGRNNSDYERALRVRNNSIALAQQSQNRSMMRPQAPVNHEIGLPQEWTY